MCLHMEKYLKVKMYFIHATTLHVYARIIYLLVAILITCVML